MSESDADLVQRMLHCARFETPVDPRRLLVEAAGRLAVLAKENAVGVECLRALWRALRMIREHVEQLSVGAMPAGEQLGPEPHEEAEAIIAGVDKALASLSRQEGWRPINEAELNCDVLAFWEKSNTMEVAERSEHVNEHGHSWLVDGDFVSNPTHWMPLPAPPPPGASS